MSTPKSEEYQRARLAWLLALIDRHEGQTATLAARVGMNASSLGLYKTEVRPISRKLVLRLASRLAIPIPESLGIEIPLELPAASVAADPLPEMTVEQMVQKQHEMLVKQSQVIAEMSERVNQLQRMLEKKVKPAKKQSLK